MFNGDFWMSNTQAIGKITIEIYQLIERNRLTRHRVPKGVYAAFYRALWCSINAVGLG
ncbi:hypothetical protein TUMSATVNIG1_22190 [Vibrio nigripulchritudo]|nr:hypothetical protein VNTUMSATTG_21960 [Vibrio nigripulchritudo]BDU31610.1 hypothetical protein TUMSATVNIG1_22190 [Vibrio nigripulchritudo]